MSRITNRRMIICLIVLGLCGLETVLSADAVLPTNPTDFLFMNFDQFIAGRIKKDQKKLTKNESYNIDQQNRWCVQPSPLPSVMHKSPNTSISGDIHDYYSLATYFWPDLTKPFPHEPYISRDGYFNPDNKKITDDLNYNKMLSLVQTCSNAYLLTGKSAHASVALTVIRTWFLNKDTKMNPNLRYAQVKRGINKNMDVGTGIIDFHQLWRILDSIIILKRTENLTLEDKTGLADWFNQFFDYFLNSPQGIFEAKAKNNHRVYYNLNVIAMANFLNKPDIWNKFFKDTLQAMDLQIKSDGTMPFEAGRASSFDYYTFCLEAYFIIARFAKTLNYPVDFYTYVTPNGGSMRKVLDLLIKYGTKAVIMPGSNVEPIEIDLLMPSLIMAGLNIDPAYLEFAKNNLEKFDYAYSYYLVTGNIRMT